MAVGNLLALLDDIALVLDDVAVMTKIAAKKTAGVLGDDLALNAQQVAGVSAARELPVVWAVAKGSAKNKLILIPIAILLSIFLPSLILPLLMLGGAFLCYEGFEKVAHKFFTSQEQKQAEHDELTQAVMNDQIDMVEYEKNKIQGAIRTDFILSAEIIVIALGTVQSASLSVQIATVCIVAALMTVGVYAVVAAIVKLDDIGLYLMNKNGKGPVYQLGKFLLWFAPQFMKTLTIVGTIAMFMVGGSILLHGMPFAHELIHTVNEWEQLLPIIGGYLGWSVEPLLNTIFGVLAGAAALLIVSLLKKVYVALRYRKI